MDQPEGKTKRVAGENHHYDKVMLHKVAWHQERMPCQRSFSRFGKSPLEMMRMAEGSERAGQLLEEIENGKER